MHVPGLKVALPATPADAKGLLKTGDPRSQPGALLRAQGDVPGEGPGAEDPEFLVPFGVAAVRRATARPTVVATGLMVAAPWRQPSSWPPRASSWRSSTPAPWSPSTWRRSSARSSVPAAPLVVHEAVRTAGAGAEIAARIQEAAFFALDAPVWRLGALDTPIPQDPDLEQLVIPSADHIEAAARELVAL